MRAWARALRSALRRAGLEPVRVGRDLHLQEARWPAIERRAALIEYQHDDALRRLLAGARPDIAVDVGANRGQFAQRLRGLGFSGPIVSLEPLPVAFAALREAAAPDPAWHCLNLAAGEADGEADFHVTPVEQFSSLLPRNTYSEARFGGMTEDAATIPVRVRRLDQLLPELYPAAATSRIFLKLDTQGYDLQAFRGMSGLGDRVVMLQSEVAVLAIYEGVPGYRDAIGAYEAAGFKLVDLFPVARDASDIGLLEIDCLMWRPPGASPA
jgi:FkbM family methyltransferase